jgi:hypothetical protein
MKTNRILVLAILALALVALAAPAAASAQQPQPGACCLPDASCVYLTESECLAASGEFQGAGSLCPASGYCETETVTVGGTTEPLGVLGMMVPVVALAVVVAAGAATTLLVKRRTA